MRKVIIVDDEKWIRRGLVQSISWDRFDLMLAGEAGDGKEAYDMVLANKPDLLFLDMRMPGIDGKQLIGMLNRDFPDLLTVVISGYSDFEYTKEAIRHKAFDYLLKPVKKEELNALLEKAVAELDRRDAEKQVSAGGQAGSWLRRLLANREGDGQTTADIHLPSAWKQGEYVVVIGQHDAFRDFGDPPVLLAAMREQMNRNKPFLFGGRWEFELLEEEDGSREAVAVLCSEKLERGDLLRLVTNIQSALRHVGAISVSFGISTIKSDAAALGDAFREARRTLAGKTLGASGIALLAEKTSAPIFETYPQEKENAFLLALQIGSREAVDHEFERLFAAFTAESMTVEHLQQCAIMLIHSIEKQLQIKDSRLEEICGKKSTVYMDMIKHRNDAVSVKAVFEEELITSVLAYYSRSGEKQGERIVSELKKLIETQYDQPLSLHQIAASLYMNPDYLSRLFKKTAGVNFVDCLTEVRIHQSKELMKNATYKNYEIAQMVGYEDYRYFSQIFKKKTGMTIGEYRSAIGQTP